MSPATAMEPVLSALRNVRARAVDTLKAEFPDLYALSVQAFEPGAPGSLRHRARLGEFLTGWKNALGSSPVEALAWGQHADVRHELAERAGIGSGK